MQASGKGKFAIFRSSELPEFRLKPSQPLTATTCMKFVELPAGWQCHPEHILKHNPPQSEAEHRIWSVLCGKAVRDQQEEVSAEVGFLVQETGLPEAEILEVLQRWQEAGGAFPKTEG